jgi:hypothetical protein
MKQTETFAEYCWHFKGVRVFKKRWFNGYPKLVEKPKSVLYWSGIKAKDVFLDDTYVVKER